MDEMKAQGVNVEEEIPVVVIPEEVEYTVEETTTKVDGAASLHTGAILSLLITGLVTILAWLRQE